MTIRVPGLDPAIQEAAGLTVRECQALALYTGQDGGGYRAVALALDISRDACRDRIRNATRKLERVMRPPGPAQPSQPVSTAPVPSEKPRTRQPLGGIQVFAD